MNQTWHPILLETADWGILHDPSSNFYFMPKWRLCQEAPRDNPFLLYLIGAASPAPTPMPLYMLVPPAPPSKWFPESWALSPPRTSHQWKTPTVLPGPIFPATSLKLNFAHTAIGRLHHMLTGCAPLAPHLILPRWSLLPRVHGGSSQWTSW
jgi:hypothetical protein